MSENLNNERHVRLQKLNDLRDQGVIPFAGSFERSHLSKEVLEEFEGKGLREVDAILEKRSGDTVKLSGRLMTIRSHGKITFGHVQDPGGRVQICFMQDLLGKDEYKRLRKFDVGDFIGLEGEVFKTRHDEITVMVYDFKMLSKALRPLPEKWHGIKGQENIYRQRYLDTIMNRDSYDRFVLRSDFVRAIREFYWQEGFMEIESPVLENVSSGTTAKPFVTKHNALDMDVYLRIAGGELWHKMAVVGGFEKVFEIGKCFRNEGIDPSHLQEFTMIEHYGAYWDYEDNMRFTEKMFESVLKKLLGTTKIKVKSRDGEEVEIDFTPPWPRHEFVGLIEGDCGINILDHDRDSLLKAIKDKGISIEGVEGLGYGNMVDHLYKKVSRPKLIQPCFVTKHPLSTKPLARKNDEDPRLCDTFQLLVNTWEVVNAYSELVDPIDQRERLEDQALAKADGDEEAMMMNEAYLRAMEHGMPCMSGWGMGIDRIITLLSGQENLKDVVLFPLLRPLEEDTKKEQKLMNKVAKKVKKS
ncbi:lysine--tRNA ligase [Candidatus Peregrinibacteria bacterium HGW-Peregrinibacteria-1]|jgi:lysyl-tRNA synthetase class 2|nr:MAG: lysine--tRNA ligase [Candidatus Peregrinibacteria bacterium HGW-Peregrinibacteria-1]